MWRINRKNHFFINYRIKKRKKKKEKEKGLNYFTLVQVSNQQF